MSKQGMKRPQQTHATPKNLQPPVPELQGKIKTGKQKAGVYNQTDSKKERPISPVYPVIDTDLGRDNLENDLTAADLQDL